MACRTVLHSVVVLTEPWSPARRSAFSVVLPVQILRPRVRALIAAPFLRCSRSDIPSQVFSQDEQGPPQEAVLKAISDYHKINQQVEHYSPKAEGNTWQHIVISRIKVSKSEGRVSQTTNVIIGGTVKDDATNEWLALDQKVNSYPTVRGFTAIGTGGDDFVNAMIVAVESVLHEPIPEDRVTHKLSSRGKYVSVNIGPIRVVSSEQVQAVYNAMRRDERMKYFL